MTELTIIPVREALGAVLDAIAPGYAVMAATERWLPLKDGIDATERAEKLLRAACATRALALVVIDPCTGIRHELPPAYCGQPGCRFTFHRARFKISDLDESDPLYPALRSYDGWPIVFVEPKFRAWLAGMAPSGDEATPTIPASATVRIRKDRALSKVEAHLAAFYPTGIPAKVTDKMIARATGVSDRTVRRARTGK